MSEEKFWTDKLVKEFMLDNGFSSWRFSIEEFKQSKTKKGWEIVAFEKWEYGENISGDTDKIKSVRRISDGEVFSLGDDCEQGKIKRFQFYGKTIIACFEYGDKGCYVNILELQKQKQPLFKTEDGKNIYEEDEYWLLFVESGSKWKPYMMLGNKDAYPIQSYMKTFSTEAAAHEYVVMNKPCLSYNDINVNSSWFGGGSDGTHLRLIDMKQLKHFVEQKINNG